MAFDSKTFVEPYCKHIEKRAVDGIPPMPLDEKQTAEVTKLLGQVGVPDDALKVHGKVSTRESLLHLLDERVPPGVYPASKVKAAFLGEILKGKVTSPYLAPADALEMLGRMYGGFNVSHLISALGLDEAIADRAAEFLKETIIVSPEEMDRIKEIASGGDERARAILKSWAEGEWFSRREAVPDTVEAIAIRTTGEINTDFLSPAQHASTRDDIPLHALQMLSTSPNDKDFSERLSKLKEQGLPVALFGDVVGTGSSRKSASNSLVWAIGHDIPNVPNKRAGGFVFASKLAPIFFNTLRGCGSVPVRCSTGSVPEGTKVKIDFKEGAVHDSTSGEILTTFEVSPPSILDEARAGGRNNLIIGRRICHRAREACDAAGIEVGDCVVDLAEPSLPKEDQPFSIAQKLVGEACGRAGVLPGTYVEPTCHLVFSQDTTGRMTQQEIQELACQKFATVTMQSFCHTPAGPRSKDARMQSSLGAFIQELGGIDFRPGDGVVHTNGNRLTLPYFVGTGGDSHTRFPVGVSFPAGSDLVAFAASQGYLPLDMPESVLVRFKGEPKPWITARDLVNAIPWAAMQQGKLNTEKGDAKINVFADRILEITGLPNLTCEEAYKLTCASAERSAAAATFHYGKEQIVRYVKNNLEYLKTRLGARHPSPTVKTLIGQFETWLEDPKVPEHDDGAVYADLVEVDLDGINEPILACPNDPDKVALLSDCAGTVVEEAFVGSCMTDVTDFRAVVTLLEGERVKHTVKFWTVPPCRETLAQLSDEGIVSTLLHHGANVHVPGCSLCMGNQGQVATNATVISTSTRNFENRMGTGAQCYLGSSMVTTLAAIHGELPSKEVYRKAFEEKILPARERIFVPLAF